MTRLAPTFFGRLSATPILRGAPTLRTEPETQRELRDKANEDERQHALFEAVTARYWVEALATELCASHRLTSDEVEALQSIQVLRARGYEEMLRWYRMGGVIAAVVATAGFAATQLPRESFDALHVGSHGYGWWRIGVAVAFVTIVLYLVLKRVPAVRHTEGLLRRTEFVGVVLAYCAMNRPGAAGQNTDVEST